MKKLICLWLLACLFSAGALASSEIEFGGLLGMRWNTANTDISSASVTAQMGYRLGVLAWIPFKGGYGVRSGILYNQRYVDLGPTLQGDIEIRYTYFDLPLAGFYQFNPAVAFFGGPVVSLNQGKEVNCSKATSCSAADVKSFILPLQIGIDVRSAYQIGAEFFYEYVSGELSKNVSNMNALGVSAFYVFE